MYYNRTLYNKLVQTKSGKAIVLIGPRQVGKTTLIKSILDKNYSSENYIFLNADDITVRQMLSQPKTELLKRIIANKKCVFIDEAQRIKNIGITLKIIVDQFQNTKLYVSGSSELDLQDKTNESLAGRKRSYNLLPISYQEFENKHGVFKAYTKLDNLLLYGMYPEVLTSPGQEREVLHELASSYLYKDILAYSGIKKSDKLEQLVQALALQVGSEVNIQELARLLGLDKNTVTNYIDILEKGFIIFRLPGFSRNIRNEIKKNQKIYFYDNGIRNIIINNFLDINFRTDKGALWENFLISERYKQHNYKRTYTKMYFWRTTQQQEIDLIEEKDGTLKAFEFKWQSKKVHFSKTFLKAYKAETQVINNENYAGFVNLENQ